MAKQQLPRGTVGVILLFCGWLLAQERTPIPTRVSDRKQLADKGTVDEFEQSLKESGYSAIPLEPSRAGYVIVTASVGKTKLRLLCDTGAPASSLDETRNKDLKIEWKKSEFEMPGGFRGQDLAKWCKIEVLEMNSFQAHGIRLYTYGNADINKSLEWYKEPPINGVLGADVLKEYSGIVDFRAMRLYLRDRH
jgi:hypothetical protein